MRWVQHPAMRPHHCAVIPFLGASNAKMGFIDTGVDLPGYDPHVYVSVEAVHEMAKAVGWVPVYQSEKAQRELDAERATTECLNAEIADLKAQLAAVDVLKNAGFKPKREKVA